MTEFAQDKDGLKLGYQAGPALLRWLPGGFLLGVIGVGAVLTAASSGFLELPQGKNVVRGEWMAAYEKNLDASLPWRDSAVNLWGTVNYRLFGEAREGVIVGTDGWLYTSEEFQTAPGDAREIDAKLAYVEQVRDELARDGARLVVALVPAKARVYPEHLGRVRVPGVKANVYEDFRHRLERAGILAPDLFRVMQAKKQRSAEDLFFRTDTHWTPYGAAVVAQALTPAVNTPGLDLPPARYEVRVRPPTERRGDLFRYLPASGNAAPAPDTFRELEYNRTNEGGAGLLGDQTFAVTLVGTSYSAPGEDNVWHFDLALARELGTDLLNVAQEGQGPVVPMREYLRSQDRQDNPPRVVVWEIPERFLHVDYPLK